jgi:hypothetical protein
MKKPYTEGLATHGDPESCAVGTRQNAKAAGEALTGESIGSVLSREIPIQYAAPTLSLEAEGNTEPCENASTSLAVQRSETRYMCRVSLRENRETR